MSDAVDKSLGFFKVFDLAFFAPGVVIMTTAAWIFWEDLEALNLEIGTAGGILAVVAGIGAIYVAGLVVFSLMRMVLEWAEQRTEQGPSEIQEVAKSGWPFFALLFEGPQKSELILYFWYLKATCQGLGTALILSSLAVAIHGRESLATFLVAAVEVLAAVVLIRQGNAYGRGVNRGLKGPALKFTESQPEPPSPPSGEREGGEE